MEEGVICIAMAGAHCLEPHAETATAEKWPYLYTQIETARMIFLQHSNENALLLLIKPGG